MPLAVREAWHDGRWAVRVSKKSGCVGQLTCDTQPAGDLGCRQAMLHRPTRSLESAGCRQSGASVDRIVRSFALFHTLGDNCMKRKVLKILAAALLGVVCSGAAMADTFRLSIGSGHPADAAVWITAMRDFFAPEVAKRVAARTGHKIEWVSAYGGSVC